MSTEFQRKYRPASLDELVGQEAAVAVIRQFFDRKSIPHAQLYHGPPGTGKTTTARIVADMVGAKGSDVVEMNAASSRGIDDVRAIQARVGQAPFNPGSTARVWILDEAHQLSNKRGGDAQTALLKTLEEPPDHVYFILCSSEPSGLQRAITSRCTGVKFSPLSLETIRGLVAKIAKKEKLKLEGVVVSKIAEISSGSGRDALKLLDQVAAVDGVDARMEILQKADGETDTITLCRKLADPRVQWSDVAECIKNLETEPETVRRGILGYFSNVALGGSGIQVRAVEILSIFRDNYYDCGKAGLVADCYETVHRLRPQNKGGGRKQ